MEVISGGSLRRQAIATKIMGFFYKGGYQKGISLIIEGNWVIWVILSSINRKVGCLRKSGYVRPVIHCMAKSFTPTTFAAAFSLSSSVAIGKPRRMANSR